MIRSILASTGELCFMLTLLRTRDLRTTNIICSTPLVRFFPYTECRSLISSLSIIIFSSGSFLIGSLANTCHWPIWNSSKLRILLRTEQIILNSNRFQQLSGGAVSHWPLLVMVTSFLRHRLEKVSIIFVTPYILDLSNCHPMCSEWDCCLRVTCTWYHCSISRRTGTGFPGRNSSDE